MKLLRYIFILIPLIISHSYLFATTKLETTVNPFTQELDMIGVISSTGTILTGNIIADNLTVNSTSYFAGLATFNDIDVDTVDTDYLTVNSTSSFAGTATFNEIDVDTITAQHINLDEINVTTVDTDYLTVNSTSYFAGLATFNDIDVDTITAQHINLDEINVTNVDTDYLTVNSTSTFTGLATFNDINVDTITAQHINLDTIDVSTGTFDVIYVSSIVGNSPVYLQDDIEMNDNSILNAYHIMTDTITVINGSFNDIITDTITVSKLIGATAQDIAINELSTATYNDVQAFINLTQGASLWDGFTISDGGSGTIDIGSGQGLIKTTNSGIGANVAFDYAGTTGLTLTDLNTNWIYVDYNAGTPITAATISLENINLRTQIVIGRVYRSGTTVSILQVGQFFDEYQTKNCRKDFEITGFERASGEILGETGVRNISVSAGVDYCAHTRITTPYIDTSSTDTFDVWNSAASTVADSTGIAQVDNANYWNGAAVVPLTTNRYGTRFFYRAFDGNIHMQYGTSNSTLQTTATNEPVPVPPHFLRDFSIYIGRVVLQQGTTYFAQITNPFIALELGSIVTVHADLAGLSADDHTQYALLAGRSGGQTLNGGTDADDNLTLKSTDGAGEGQTIIVSSQTISIGDDTTYGIVVSSIYKVSIGSDVAAPSGNDGYITFKGDITQDGSSNYYGATNPYTHVNLGYNSVAGTSGNNYSYATISGGNNNTAGRSYATVGGGGLNKANLAYATVSGGNSNTANADSSSIGGGDNNITSGIYSVVSGGDSNSALNSWDSIGGGQNNYVNTNYSTISGGHDSIASGLSSTIGGGFAHTTYGSYSTVGGGSINISSGGYSTISGGRNNTAADDYSFIGGGYRNTVLASSGTIAGGTYNTASGTHATISGGQDNTATAIYSTISGGFSNNITGSYSVIGGGNNNDALTGLGMFIGGGYTNSASANFATISGGQVNAATGAYSFIGGGSGNNVAGINATISGGEGNTADDNYSFIGGGQNNTADEEYNFIGGGYNNTVLTSSSTIAGGANNTINASVASDGHSFIGGGNSNNTYRDYSSIVGGELNVSSSVYTFVGGGKNNTVLGTSGYGLIVGGSDNSVASNYNTIGGGYLNTIATNSNNSTISGGAGNDIIINSDTGVIGGGNNNTVANNYSTIAGGNQNTVTGDYSFIGGGTTNDALTGTGIVIGGGNSNTADASYSTICGGNSNTVDAIYSFIGGGTLNDVYGIYSSISGGNNNIINTDGDYATIGGGVNNIANGLYASVGGGQSNDVFDNFSTISGGSFNVSSGTYCTIGGGNINDADGLSSVISGGRNNIIDAEYATIPGGRENDTYANYSLVGGRFGNLGAAADYTFCWAAAESAQSAITDDHAFLIFPYGNGNCGIGTTAPGKKLDVNGNADISGNLTLNTGATVSEFSTDGTLNGDSDSAVPTEQAVKTYVTSQVLRQYYADQLDTPNNSDWTVNALANLQADSNNAALSVRNFDATTEEGVGFSIYIPTNVSSMTLTFISRAETAPAGARTVGLKLYERGLPGAVDSWSSGTALADINISTNENWLKDIEVKTLTSWGITSGQIHQFELTRVNPSGGTELTGDWVLYLVIVTFN